MLELVDISKTIREANGQQRQIFSMLNLTIPEGCRSIAIVGRSGSGKSTLLRLLAGLDNSYQGQYFFRGKKLSKTLSSLAKHRLDNVGIVSQSYDLLTDRTVLQNVRIAEQMSSGESRSKEYLTLVGLENFFDKHPQELSGGEAQRVAIARAIVKNPLIVLADEPTGALDEENENVVLDLFRRLQNDGVTFVVATHSERVASSCERRMILRDRQLHEID